MADKQKTDSQSDSDTQHTGRKLSFLALMLTTFAAAFGVQSDKNRERDFNQNSIVPYIAAGVIFTALFVVGLFLLVKLVVA